MRCSLCCLPPSHNESFLYFVWFRTKTYYWNILKPFSLKTYLLKLFKLNISLITQSGRNSSKLGSQRGNDIHGLGQRYLIAPDTLPKVRRQIIPTNCKHSVLTFCRAEIQLNSVLRRTKLEYQSSQIP